MLTETNSKPEEKRRPFTTTERDMEMYQAIVAYKRANDGCSPPTRELMRACSMGSTSVVSFHLGRLVRAGLIERGAGKCQLRVRGGRWSCNA